MRMPRPGVRAAVGAVPSWLHSPHDANAIVPELWATGVGKSPAGVLTVAGVAVTALAADFGTPAYIVDEDDFRARARSFAVAFAGGDVYYAAKAFLCVGVVRWIAEEGLGLDVCSAGELAVALRAGFDARRIGFHGNNKSADELTVAVRSGVGRIIVDSRLEIQRLARVAATAGVRQHVLVRVTPGVDACTHGSIATSHEDQKFGLSIAGGDALAALRDVVRHESLVLSGLHFHLGSQVFGTAGFEVAARRVLGLHAQAVRIGLQLPELCVGGGFGIAYTSQDDPATAATLAAGIRSVVERECEALGVAVPRLSVEPGRAIAGPSTFTLYTVGTVKSVALPGVGSRLYVAVDGGMSDNMRTALYGADFSCTLASRSSSAAPALARVVGKHCESGDIVVRDEFLPSDVAPGDLIAVPGTGAYCRSLASTYNWVPRPPVVAVRQGQPRLLVRRENLDDLIRLDVDPDAAAREASA
jgi:diaminopimelate decarboxylase